MNASLNSIRTFVASARLGSFTRAAASLHVSQGAVSQQVARLEEALGVRLFERESGRLQLTTHGRRLLLAVSDSVDRIDDAVGGLRQRSGKPELRLTALASFSAHWLMPRLPAFEAACPDVCLRLENSNDLSDLAGLDVDAGIRSGAGDWPGLVCEWLLDDVLWPVASPATAATLNLAAGPSVLAGMPLFHDLDGPDDWPRWFAAAGIEAAPQLSHGFSDTLVMHAALRHSGAVALSPTSVVEDAVASGELVRLFDLAVSSRCSAWLIYPVDTVVSAPLAAFRGWLLEAAAAYRSSLANV